MIPKPDCEGEKYQVPKARCTITEFNEIKRKTTMNGYAMIDVADSTSAGSDFTGCIVVFVTPNGARFRVDVRREKRNVKAKPYAQFLKYIFDRLFDLLVSDILLVDEITEILAVVFGPDQLMIFGFHANSRILRRPVPRLP